jgi:sugar lactone lactonase YvrE
VIINGVTPLAAVAAVAVVIRVLLGIVTTLAGSGQGFADGTGAGASFYYPFGLAVLPDGNIVVADTFNNRIRLVNPTSAVVTTLAGSNAGYGDGTGTGPTASFFQPYGVAVIPSNNVIVVADTANNRIRRVTYPGGVVTTLAGGNAAFADGTGEGAKFSGPHGVAVTSTGVIVVADADNHRIRLVTQAGVVTTLAGSSQGFADGTGAAASFNGPRGVAVTSTGDIVVADSGNNRIRLVTPAGVVTTLAGNGGGTFADGTGTGASFWNLRGVAVTSTGDVVVADTFNNRIRLIV